MESRDRLIVAPANGIFVPSPDFTAEGSAVEVGQIVGTVRRGADLFEVASYIGGVTRQVLAWHDERVRMYQPLLWLEAS